MDIKCDSSKAIFWILAQSFMVWYSWNYWDELFDLLTYFNFTINHQIWEGNHVADNFVHLGVTGEKATLWDITEVPRHVTDPMWMDKSSMAYITNLASLVWF